MPTLSQSTGKVKKKVTKACDRCRSMKLKCSGTQPCTRCSQRNKQCHFAVEDRRISVPESYLRELEHRHSISLEHRQGSHTGSQNESHIYSPNLGNPVVSPSPLATQRQASLDSPHGDSGSRPRRRIPAQDDTSLNDLLEIPESHNLFDETFSGDHFPQDKSDEGIGPVFRRNPLADNDYTFAKSPEGRYFYMGPSSSWSFCRRVLALIGKHVPEANCPPDPWHPDGVAFKMQWRPLGPNEVPDTTNLPPKDYALFLFSTVKFYFGHIFYLIDEPSYVQHLHELYENAPAKASTSKLWYAQYLLILAFGKAFVVQNRSHEGPPGYHYALRAMSLLPHLSESHSEPILSIQALTLAALYLQSVDIRVAAFQHIGYALRICVVEGIHRHMPEDVVGAEHSRRCNMIFWVVYMIDREFSALIGAPNSIRDEDITAKLPSQINNTLEALNMTLHIRLCRLMASILTTVYGVGKESDGSLVKNTQSILLNLAWLSEDLTAFLNTHFQGSVSRTSRMALRLILSYHHCVVLTTRPLVMCALHTHIERPEIQKSQTISLAPPVASLMQSCADSAQTVLHTLRAIGDEDLLEAFLPFQLEDTFSSAFLLYVIRVVAPSLLRDDTWCENAHCILDKMISKGSLVAPLRKLELSQLESIMTPLTPAGIPPTIPSPLMHQGSPGVGLESDANPGMAVEEPGWDVFDANARVGLSPQELLQLARQFDMESLMQPGALEG